VNGNIIASSIGINQSTTNEYPFSMVGNARILPALTPTLNHILLATVTATGVTTYTASNPTGKWSVNNSLNYSGKANAAAYNGSLWVIVGSNTNQTGFIKAGSKLSDTFVSASYPNNNTALLELNTVKWNGSYWLAGGTGDSSQTPTLLTSTDGIKWNGVYLNNPINIYNDLAWNGYQWVAVGSDPTGSNILYTDVNGNWNQAINSFDIQGNAVTNNGRTWVVVGQGSISMKYSYNGKNWEDIIGAQLSTANTVAWNGDKFVAGGSNGNNSNLMYSYDGVNWTYVPTGSDPSRYVTKEITSVLWDGTAWSATGLNSGSNNGVYMRSYDAINWSTVNILGVNGISLIRGTFLGQAYASNTTPTIQLSNFDIYSGETPVMMNSRKRMNIIQSTIYFNDGDLTIRRLTSSIPLSYIGINTTYPEYALDIAVGNARKPVGTTWLTASDERVKSDIVPADLLSCAKLVSEISLRQYSFTNEFQKKTGTSSDAHYGFIAQEVKSVLPNAIHYTKEYGLDDFHSLDTDQIFKLEFGATQYLLNRIEAMEAQVSTLEKKMSTS